MLWYQSQSPPRPTRARGQGASGIPGPAGPGSRSAAGSASPGAGVLKARAWKHRSSTPLPVLVGQVSDPECPHTSRWPCSGRSPRAGWPPRTGSQRTRSGRIARITRPHGPDTIGVDPSPRAHQSAVRTEQQTEACGRISPSQAGGATMARSRLRVTAAVPVALLLSLAMPAPAGARPPSMTGTYDLFAVWDGRWPANLTLTLRASGHCSLTPWVLPRHNSCVWSTGAKFV